MIVSKEDVEQFQSKVEKGFTVTGSAVGEGFVAFNVAPRQSHEESYEAVFNQFKGEDYVPLYRKTRKGLRVLVVHKKYKKKEVRPLTHFILLVLTAMTVTWAGYVNWTDGKVDQSLMFAASLMGVLGIHELGHTIAARRRKIDATLPFFIPAPPMIFPFGTFGAVIFMGSPAKNRNSLIDVGLAGPLAGFLVSIPITILGLTLSTIEPISAIAEDEFVFTMPLILQLLSEYILGPIGTDSVIQPHPIAMAGWAGFFVTSLNLLPMGQLDGGHVIRGLFPVQFRRVYQATAVILFVPGMLFISSIILLNFGILFPFSLFFALPPFFIAIGVSLIWLVWVILVWFLTRLDHPGPLNDVSQMDTKRKIYGAAILLLLLILCFTPAPVIPTEMLSNV